MKRGLLAQPGVKWNGFRPVPYMLDLEKVLSLPLIRIDGQLREPTTVGIILASLRDRKIERVESCVTTEVTTDEGVLSFADDDFNQHLLSVLADLQKDKIDGFSASWFWFAHDWNLRDIHESYSFFVVSARKVVREHIRFSDWPGGGFDPAVFTTDDPETWNWSHDQDWVDAETRYWYRQFYEATHTGQLMTLRPDFPTLYHFTRQPKPALRPAALKEITYLLWAAIALLTASAFPTLKDYMAILALGLIAQVFVPLVGKHEAKRRIDRRHLSLEPAPPGLPAIGSFRFSGTPSCSPEGGSALLVAVTAVPDCWDYL